MKCCKDAHFESGLFQNEVLDFRSWWHVSHLLKLNYPYSTNKQYQKLFSVRQLLHNSKMILSDNLLDSNLDEYFRCNTGRRDCDKPLANNNTNLTGYHCAYSRSVPAQRGCWQCLISLENWLQMYHNGIVWCLSSGVYFHHATQRLVTNKVESTCHVIVIQFDKPGNK